MKKSQISANKLKKNPKQNKQPPPQQQPKPKTKQTTTKKQQLCKLSRKMTNHYWEMSNYCKAGMYHVHGLVTSLLYRHSF